MADSRFKNMTDDQVVSGLQQIRDIAYTHQNNRRTGLTLIEQIASKMVQDLTGSDAARTPSPVIPRKEPTPAAVATASVTASGAPTADDLKTAAKVDEEQRKAADAKHAADLAGLQAAGAPIFPRAEVKVAAEAKVQPSKRKK